MRDEPRRMFEGPIGSIMLFVLSWATGCTLEARETAPASYPNAGLYAPGSTLGASDPTDVPVASMGLGNRCVQPPIAVENGATPGTLSVNYTTQSLRGRYAPKNCTAAWVETVTGNYVTTLELRAGLRRPGLVYWQDHACVGELGPDVMSGATLRDHTRPHAAMWSGSDFSSKPLPDGSYKLFIEVTESDKEPGELSVFDFQKGPLASGGDTPVAFDGPLRQVSIVWNPMLGRSSGGAAGGN